MKEREKKREKDIYIYILHTDIYIYYIYIHYINNFTSFHDIQGETKYEAKALGQHERR